VKRPGGRTERGSRVVYGVHPVTELLSSRSRDVERIFVVQGRHARLGGLLRLARERGVPVTHVAREALVRKVGRGAVHQGVAARVASWSYASADDLCTTAAGDPGALLVLVDRVTDPRNLGAILRTAAGAGVRGVLLAADDTVGLTPLAVKASAGAVESVLVAREPKPGRRLAALRAQGFRIVGLDAAGQPVWEGEPLTGRIVFVAGGEQAGPSAAVARACDRWIAVPLAPGVESLNVAVALGVLLFEAVRQRRTVPRRP
jgi:23S rRNA (guanosine2251-2'-O)-methyltransferase